MDSQIAEAFKDQTPSSRPVDPASSFGKQIAEKRERGKRQEFARNVIMLKESDPGEILTNWGNLNMWIHAQPTRRTYLDKLMVRKISIILAPQKALKC